MQTFADAEVVLRQRVPQYASRSQQQELARAIERMFTAHTDRFDTDPPTHLFAQAGTGCGKSRAALVPAILSGKRVVYSVTTKALQDQLTKTDLPFLEANLGIDISWCTLMGRGNYWCLKVATAADGDLSTLPDVIRYSDQNPDWDGLAGSLPFPVPAHEWAQMASDAEACHEAKCKRTAQEGFCYAERARWKAQNSQIIVVNHALTIADLKIKAAGADGMLGQYDLLIADEAHRLEKVVGDNLGEKIKERTFRFLARDVRGWVHHYGDPDELDNFTELTMQLVEAAVALFGPDGPPKGRIRTATLNEHVDSLAAMSTALRALRAAWSELDLENVPTAVYPRAKLSHRMVTARVLGAVQRYHEVLGSEPDLVRWVAEDTDRNGATIKVFHTCPISVAPFLRRHLFSRVPVVLLSATLSVGGRFDFVAKSLGIDRYTSVDVGTPFNYREQARRYVPSLPDPRGDSARVWEAAVDEEILRLIDAARGRSLVLFTSRKHMLRCADRIGHRITYPLLVQGSAPVPELSRRFKAEVDSVLFGLDSFGTGFDVPGEALSLLIVTRIPMTPPDEPLYEARCDVIAARGGKGFFELGVPLASLTLQQMDGRAIRQVTDTAVTALLDPRLNTTGYGRQLVRDLPAMPTVSSVAEVAAFLAPADDRKLIDDSIPF